MSDAFPSPRSPKNKWQSSPTDPTIKSAKSNRGRKLYWLTAFLLAILGITAAILLYPRTMAAPRFLSMTVREYRPPLMPPNAWANQDGQRLAGHFDKDLQEFFYVKQSRESFRLFISRLQSLGDGPVVVHLGALGRVHKGQVRLFLADADLDHGSQEIPLKEILDAMRPDASKKGAASSRRLLILDVARPVADAHVGILADDLAAAVHAELVDAKLPYFAIAACADGQMSHVSEELGASVFAYHLDLGLRGFAAKKNDTHITVKQLAEFAGRHVDRWVWFNRGQRQQPRLYGQSKDFPIVQIKGTPAEMPALPEEAEYPAWLKDGWTVRDGLLADGSYRRAPWLFRSLELELAQTERRWRSGDDDIPDEKKSDSRLKKYLDAKVRELKEKILSARETGNPRAFSLAEIKNAETDALIKTHQNAFDYYMRKIADPKGKADDTDKIRLDEAKLLKAKLIDDLQKLPYESAAALISAAAERLPDLTPARIFALVDLHVAIRKGESPERRFVEIIYLERLRDLLVYLRGSAELPESLAQFALRAEWRAAEVFAALARMPSGYEPWNRELIQRGELLRQQGDRGLFDKKNFAWAEAQAAFVDADATLRVVPKRLEFLKSIQENRDQAFLLLPGWAPSLIAQPRTDATEMEVWQEGVRAAGSLADALEAKDPRLLDSEPAALARWQVFERNWQRRMRVRLARIETLAIDEGVSGDYLEWNALLESPRLSANQRADIWSKTRKLGRKLIEKMPAPNTADNDLIGPGEDPTPRQEHERAKRRVKLSVELLNLAAYPDIGPISESDADKLRDVLIRDVPATFLKYAMVKEPRAGLASRLAKADRLSRVFPLDVMRKVDDLDQASEFRNPARGLYRLEQGDFWGFLRERYNGEARNLEARNGQKDHQSFFGNAARAFPP